MLRTMIPPWIDNLTRETLATYFEDAWRLQEWLFTAVVDDAAWYMRPDPLRNPLIFYLGHPAAFYVNKLRLSGAISRPADEALDRLFEIGVDPEWSEELDAVLRGIEWPSVERVRDYRRLCHSIVSDTLPHIQLEWPTSDISPLWAMLMSIEHDRIHFETSSVLLRQLPLQYLRRPHDWTYAPAKAGRAPSTFEAVPRGVAVIGKDASHPTYGWDNEYGEMQTRVKEFAVTRCLVSNGEYSDFVKDGGYSTERWWEPDGWEWRRRLSINGPRFWEGARRFDYRAMFDILPLPEDWPAEVTYHEATAFCRWRGKVRLPTEAEWIRIRDEYTSIETDDLDGAATWNLHLKHGSPESVTANATGRADRRVYDVQGNVWQWTATVFAPLPGFRPSQLYEDFSSPFFTPQHMMMLGGSWATTGTAASRYYRLWFRKHFRQHAGFRMVECGTARK